MKHSLEYGMGFVIGIAAGFALIALLVWLIKKFGGKTDIFCKKDSFDERQLLARGKAYKAAFFTQMIYMTAIALLNDIANVKVFMSFGGMWIGVCISITVFAIVCIIKDAYMSLYENAKGVILMFGIVGMLNLSIGFCKIKDDDFFIEKGVISVNSVNLIVGIVFVIILLVFCAKLIYDKKNNVEEE